jgi:Flp pilus assembly pilin Flp
MKIDLTQKIRIAKRTKLGRFFCRLAGDRSGAVMMEYVILGVLIAAAATLAAIYFGKGIVSSFSTMTHATSGKVDKAEETSKANQAESDKAQTESENARKSISGGDSANQANK